MAKTESEFHELEQWVRLRKAAPKMLDALRLIYFAVTTDYESAKQRADHIRTLCEAALQGTEDI